MLYKYRYYGVSLIMLMIFFTGYFIDIQSQLANVLSLHAAIMHVNEGRNKNSATLHTVIADEPICNHLLQQGSMTLLLSLAARYDVQIKQIARIASPFADLAYQWHLSVQASPDKVALWLNALNHATLNEANEQVAIPIWLQNFSYDMVSSAPDQSVLTVDVLLLTYNHLVRPIGLPTFTVHHALFCQVSTSLPIDAVPRLDLYPFARFKMVGFIARDQQQMAWIELPNAETIAISKGDKLGKEKALVTRIDATHIYLQSTPHQSFVITMRE